MSIITALNGGHAELVGLLRSREDLERALALFGSEGWHRSELSLLAQDKVLLPEHLMVETASLSDDSEARRAAPVSGSDIRQARILVGGIAGSIGALTGGAAIIANGGSVAVAALGALISASCAVALVELFGHRIGFIRRRFLREQAEHGGILLWVKVKDRGKEKKALDIFRRLHAKYVHRRKGP